MVIERRRRRGAGASGSILPPAFLPNPPDLYLDFTTNSAATAAGNYSTATSLLSVSRASPGTVNDSNGNWSTIPAAQPRRSNLGLLVEEQRINSIRNNLGPGGAAGSQGIVMADGRELTTNGSFAGASGSGGGAVVPNWTLGVTGNIVASPGSIALTGDGSTHNTYISQQITGLVPGRSYVIAITSTGAGSCNLYAGNSANDSTLLSTGAIVGNGNASANADRAAFTATATSHWVTLAKIQVSTVTVNSISVSDGERCQNGSFAANAVNAGQSVVQNGWQWKVAAGTNTPSYAAGSLTLVPDGTNLMTVGTGAIPTVAGCTYTVTYDMSANISTITASAALLDTGASLLSVSGVLGTQQKVQFTATGSTTFLNFKRQSAGNSTIANVSVQSAGALPTNWGLGGGSAAGLRWNVIGLSTVNGVNCIDVEFVGTTNSTSFNFNMEASGIITSSYGQTWSLSGFFAVVGGSTINVTNTFFTFSDVGGSQGNVPPSTSINTTPTLVRTSTSGTLTSSGNTSIRPSLLVNVSNTSAVDITFRIGWPQLEQNPLISASCASAVVVSGGTSGYAVNDTVTLTATGGTAATVLKVTAVSSGVITAVSVQTAGSYTTFPASPASQVSTSGAGVGTPTFTLTPTNNAASGFATSPIPTNGAATTRNTDIITLSSAPAFGSAYSLYAAGTPQAPTAFVNSQFIIGIDDGSSNNRFLLARTSLTGVPKVVEVSGGTQNFNTVLGGAAAWTALGKLAMAGAASDQRAAFNGSLDTNSYASVMPVGANNVTIGQTQNTALFDGFIAQAAIWKSQRISNAMLQSITA